MAVLVQDLSFAQIQQGLTAGTLSCTSLVDSYLERIASSTGLNIFLEVYADEARAQAKAVDEKRATGTAGKLAGMVLAVKDVICQEGHSLSASSRILHGFQSLFTATSLQRLIAEDAIIIGRVGCDEFAMGSSNENSAYGPIRNPLNPDYVPGGSSGGSSAAVAAGCCTAALGSDTGGSIRQPAAFCGLVGIKPTYGRVSRYGLIAYASSFDQIGPIARNADDCALLMNYLAGHDPQDNTSSTQPVPDYTTEAQAQASERYHIGIIREGIESPGLDPEIREHTLRLTESLKAAGHTVEYVDFPVLDYLVPTYYILTTAEASSNLSRYDGIRYGHRSDKAHSLESVYTLSRTEGFGAEVQRRILLGTFVLSSGYYDAYYTKAQKVRRIISDSTKAALRTCDFLISPTTPCTPFKIGEKVDDPISMYLSDIYTVHANLSGNPAISLPLATHSNSLPIGLHVLGRHFDEGRLLRFANHVQWFHLNPPN